jgi:hypothetical protein
MSRVEKGSLSIPNTLFRIKQLNTVCNVFQSEKAVKYPSTSQHCTHSLSSCLTHLTLHISPQALSTLTRFNNNNTLHLVQKLVKMQITQFDLIRKA